MSLSVHVQGGTVARRRDFRGQAQAWQCGCREIECCECPTDQGECCGEPELGEYREQPGYMASCLDCGERRPE